jgi:hypothetical protein
MPVDLSWVTPGWECKRGRWRTEEEATVKRAREVVEWIAGREEEEIVIVSHREFSFWVYTCAVTKLRSNADF